MSEPVQTVDELIVYFDAVYFATVALKGRIAKLGPEFRPAVEIINRYQAIAKRYHEALEQTAAMRWEGAKADASL